MQTTTNYGLKKPEKNEFYNADDQNTNMDVIDAELKKGADHIADKSNPHSVTALQVGALPTSGGTLDGALWVQGGYARVSGDPNHANIAVCNVAKDFATSRALLIQNAKFQSDIANALLLRNMTNGVANDYYILHAGNFAKYAIPRTGGTITSVNFAPLTIERTDTGNAAIKFMNSLGVLGYLAMSTKDGNFYRFQGSDMNMAHKILDTGNSAPVVISATAPTDTTVLWVDTTAMKMKIYKNNAWTALT